jgi:hypothetical protein
MDERLLVNPALLEDGTRAFRYDESLYICKRPVFNPMDWVDRMEALLRDRPVIRRPDHLDWDCVWPRFETWLRKGLASVAEMPF